MLKEFIDGKKAILFDLDGTIVDTSAVWVRAMTVALQTVLNVQRDMKPYFFPGITLEQIWKNALVHMNFYDKKLVPELVKKTHDEFISIVQKEGEACLPVTEGFWMLAREFKQDHGQKLALVSNSHSSVVNAVCDALGLTFIFDLIVTGDQIKKPKPDKEIYVKALKLLKISSKEALCFEDSPAGVKAACDANLITFCIYNFDFPPRELYPLGFKLFILNFTEVVGAFKESYYVSVLKNLKAYYDGLEQTKSRPN